MTHELTRPEVIAWRKARRAELIAARLALDQRTRQQYGAVILEALARHVGEPERRIVSLYWPFRGEPDLRPWIKTLENSGARCALPVVIAKGTPLVFRLWRTGDPLVPGVWNIPVPERGAEVAPDVVIAPIVGFDDDLFRLGYGGGFFDRTLAAMPSHTLVIGVGYAQFRLDTIHPLPHDIPMDVIITEREVIGPHRERRAR